MDVDHFTEDCVGFSNTSVDLKTPLSEDVELNQDHLQSDGNECENIKGASNENDTTEVIPHLVISEVTSLQPDCQNKQTEVTSDYENEGEKCGGQDIIKEKTVLSNDNGSSRLTHDSTGGLELSVECVVDNKNVQLADQRSIIIDGDNESENSSNEIVMQDQKSIDSIERQQVVLNKIARRGISVMPNKFLNDSMASQSDVLALSDGTETNSCNGSRRSDTISQATKKFKTDLGCSSNIDQDFNPLTSCVSTGLRKKEILTAGKEDNFDQGDSESNTESDKNMQIPLNNKMDDGNGDCRVINTIYCTKRNSFDEDNEDISEIVTKPTKNITGNVIIEGSAEILLSATKNVFYNKVQEFNRDMSIAALTVFSEMHQQDPRTRNKGKKRQNVDMSESDQKDGALEVDVFEQGVKADNGITILEALSATGLRSIRYAKEIPGVKEVVANDLSEDAVETIKKNIKHNHVDDLISTTMSDASLLMYQRAADQRWYDAIDLDPYGCPSRFLAAAVQAVRDGGLLLVTCTDMAVLAGNSPETCYAKYGAISLRSPACHEMALRIALQCIESHANRYGRYIVPLLSFSADFYIRLMVQIYTSPVTCKKTTSKLSMVYQCVGCQTQTLQPLGQMAESNGPSQPKFNLTHGPPVNTLCYHCHHKHTMGGPIWSAPIYNTKFVENMLRIVETSDFATGKRMQGMLEVIREELPDVPLYYTVKGLCARLHCQAIPLVDIKSAILNAGYRVSSSHAAPTAVKTNAPSKVIWDIMRCWVHMNPVSEKRLIEGSVPAAVILEPPTLIANFDIHPRARPSSSMRKLVRYQPNPERNWGPGTRAKCNNGETDKDSKRITNQNKHKNKNKNVAFIEVVTIDDDDGENVTKAHG